MSTAARSSVLIVDDTDIGRDLIAGVLLREGYDLEFAADGEQALVKAQELKPDLILLDVMMPGIDGFEVCRRLRADPEIGKIPIVMVTALDDRHSRIRGYEVGADDFVTKPFDRRELKTRVRTIVRLNRFRHLLAERDRLRRLIQVSPYGVLVIKKRGEIEMANDVIGRWLGLASHEELLGRDIASFWSASDLQPHQSWLKSVFRTDEPVRIESRLERADGQWFPVDIAAARVLWEDDEYRAQVVISDISKRKSVEDQLLQGVFYDRLTGLPNRMLFLERVEQAQQWDDTREGESGMLLLDLDHFRALNDSLGHAVGDQLLIALARRLKQFAKGAVIARIFGDEFALFQSGLSGIAELKGLASRLFKDLQRPFAIGDQEIRVNVSAGIVFIEGAELSADELLRNADTALQIAKTRGRARSVVFDEPMREAAVGFVRIFNDLRVALERSELYLVYQPIVDISSHKAVALEALVRWKHPQRGLIMPSAFIDLAEQTGLILEMGNWILEEACRTMVDWRSRDLVGSELQLHVNISARQLAQPGFGLQVESTLLSTGLPPGVLQVELTESAIMENPEASSVLFTRLKKMGVGLHMDDFGTGYSSFSYLSRIPLDALKIDRSFIDKMNTEAKELEIVKTIIQLGQNLRLATIAEGVETEEQTRLLRAMGCELAQGYYYARPTTADEIPAILQQLEA